MTDQTEREKFEQAYGQYFNWTPEEIAAGLLAKRRTTAGYDSNEMHWHWAGWKMARAALDGGAVSLPAGYAITERPYDYCLSKDGYSLLTIVKEHPHNQSFNKHLLEFFRALHDAQKEKRG